MNPRVEKSANVLLANRDQEGTELWVGMYDLLFDYQALLLDYNELYGLHHDECDVVETSDEMGTTHDTKEDYSPDGYPYPRPARWIRTSPMNPDMADMADPPDKEDR